MLPDFAGSRVRQVALPPQSPVLCGRSLNNTQETQLQILDTRQRSISMSLCLLGCWVHVQIENSESLETLPLRGTTVRVPIPACSTHSLAQPVHDIWLGPAGKVPTKGMPDQVCPALHSLQASVYRSLAGIADGMCSGVHDETAVCLEHTKHELSASGGQAPTAFEEPGDSLQKTIYAPDPTL